jgi:hypothetical protein
MTRRGAITSTFEDHPGAETVRPNRHARRLARRHRNRRAAGLVGALVFGVSATAAGLSFNPTPQIAGASESVNRGSGTRQLPELELAVARKSVLARPVEGVLLTHAAKVNDQERIAAAVAAAAEAARAASVAQSGHTGVNWDSIAECETGGNWSMQGSRFSGGVGFANTTWNGFGGREFAPNAGQATREQQIVVAERVYAQYGLSGWGCKAHG